MNDRKPKHFISFNDGRYKEVTPVEINYVLEDGSIVTVNPQHVSYIHCSLDEGEKV